MTHARRLLVFLAGARIDIAHRRHLACRLVVDELLHLREGAQLEFRIGEQRRQDADIGRSLGVGFAAEALAVAAIFAGAKRQAFEIGVDLARIARWRLERMVAEASRRLVHDGSGHALGQRRIWILVLSRPFEHVAAVDFFAAQIAGLAGDAAQLLELVVIRLELVIGDGQVLDRHLGGNGVLAVALSEMDAQLVIGRQPPPGHAVPVRAGAAEIGAWQERAETPDRQCRSAGEWRSETVSSCVS